MNKMLPSDQKVNILKRNMSWKPNRSTSVLDKHDIATIYSESMPMNLKRQKMN